MFFYNEEDTEVSYEQPGESVDPYFYNTSLLLNMDSDFSDSSVYQNSVTTGGNATVSTTESKFGGGSGYFDGATNTEVSCVSADQFDLRGADWTIEAWVNPNGDYSDWRMIVTKRVEGPTENYQIYLNRYDGFLGFFVRDGVSILSTSTLTTNQWNHVAAVRHNNTISLYLNGQIVGSQAGDVNHTNVPVSIGSIANSEHHKFIGHIDDVRITKGVARYTTNFTPPTEAHPTTGPSEIATSGMVLELDAENYDTVGYNGGTKTGAANDAIYVGTDEKYFQFNGAGHISFPSNPAYSFGTGAFTVEFWIQGSLSRIVQADNTIDGSGNDIWWAGMNPTWGAMLNAHGPGTRGFRGGISYDVNNWGHFVMIRNPGSNAVYLNGELQSLTHNNIDGVSVGQSGIIIGAGTANVFSTGKIAAVRVYNRALTHVEAVQNFDATKDRFGL